MGSKFYTLKTRTQLRFIKLKHEIHKIKLSPLSYLLFFRQFCSLGFSIDSSLKWWKNSDLKLVSYTSIYLSKYNFTYIPFNQIWSFSKRGLMARVVFAYIWNKKRMLMGNFLSDRLIGNNTKNTTMSYDGINAFWN